MKYIFLDIDGTLIGSFTHEIPKSAVKAIMMARDNGHKLFICTGRPQNSVKKFDCTLFDGLVCSAGGYVEIDQQLIFERTMSKQEIEHIMQVLQRYHVGFFLEGKNANYYQAETQEYLVEMFKQVDEHAKWEDIQEKMQFLEFDNLDADQIYKVSFPIKDQTKLKQIIDEFSNQFNVVYTHREEGSVIEAEIMIPNCNKAEGAKKVVEHFGATLKDAVAFGDSMNDFEMIQECAIGVAMGNACDELKSVANEITAHVQDDGLYKGFKTLNLI